MNEPIDNEIAAMKAIYDALDPLTGDQVDRVLRWACDRFSVSPATP